MTESGAVARAAKATTCDKLLDHSNYWQPQLYHQRTDGMFEIVTFQGIVSDWELEKYNRSLWDGSN